MIKEIALQLTEIALELERLISSLDSPSVTGEGGSSEIQDNVLPFAVKELENTDQV